MVDKAVDVTISVLKVAYAGYVAWKLGSALYSASQEASCGANTEERKEQKNVKEEVQREPVKYELDASQDIASLTCPITMQIIEEPASTVYGHLFELSAIRDWVRMRGVCPLTQQPLREYQIYPQYGLKDTIAEMRRIKKENEDQRLRIEELEFLAASQSLNAQKIGKNATDWIIVPKTSAPFKISP